MKNRSAWQIFASLVLVSLVYASPAQAQDEYVYWVDEAQQQIWRGRADGTEAEVLVRPRLLAALDVADDTLFWVDSAARAILRRALGGTQTDTLVTDLILFFGETTVLEIDPLGRMMYWLSGTGQEDTYNLYRADLDGTDVAVVVAEVHLFNARALAVDGQAGKLYWAEKTPGVSMQTILRANLNGTGVETVVPEVAGVVTLAVDPVQGKLYWADNNARELLRANLDGTGVETLLSDVILFSIALDPMLGKIYFDAGATTLQRANLDGTGIETLLTDFQAEISSLTLRPESGDIFWIGKEPLSAGRILRAHLDSADVEEVIAGFGVPAGVAFDPTHKKMYWTDGAGILRANVDGTGVETVAPYVSCGIGSATDVELDLLHDRIYWGRVSDCGRGIGRANLDGTSVESVPILGEDYASFIALDPATETVYWTQVQATNRILRIGFDGTNGEIVIDGPACGIALDLISRKLYWADCPAGQILRANLDGTETEVLLSGLAFPYDLALDLEANHLYWSERRGGKIRRAFLDGTGVEDLFTGLAAPARLALSFESNTSVSLESVGDLPEAYQLWPNYPNPFNTITTLRYALPQAGHVVLSLYDVRGRRVRVLADGMREAGVHEVILEAGALPSGMYVYRLETSEGGFTQRMLLVK